MTPRQSMKAAIVTVMVVPVTAWAAQQQPDAQMTGMAQAAVTACAQAQPMAERTIDATNRRIESARQANSPAAMRAAIDDMQAALRQLRVEIAPCAALQSIAPADPGAGHVMPGAPTPNVVQASAPAAVAPAAPAPSGVADPHAGHVMPGAPPATAPAARAATQAQPDQASSTRTPTITFRSTPSLPRGAAENQFEVTVKDRQGNPINGADVSLLLYMPAMPSMKMPEMRNEVKLKAAGKGRYTGTGEVMMAGQWTVTVSVKQNGKEIGQQKVTITAK